jgi:hypothetical protein
MKFGTAGGLVSLSQVLPVFSIISFTETSFHGTHGRESIRMHKMRPSLPTAQPKTSARENLQEMKARKLIVKSFIEKFYK